MVRGSGTYDKTGHHCLPNDPNGKLRITHHAGYWLHGEDGRLTKVFRHICWDGCMFPNYVMMSQQTWNDILSAMIAIRDAHGWRESEREQTGQGYPALSIPSIQEELPKRDKLMGRLNSLIGLPKVKEDASRLVNLVKVRRARQQKGMKATPMSLHLVFTGNPGTGKTTVARLLGEVYHDIGILSRGHLTETDRSGLVAGYLGQTAIKVNEVVGRALGGILFIDEAYSLAQEGQWDQFGREAIDTLLKRMEDHRDDLIVIVAGYTAPMKAFLESNPGLRSRFNKFLHFDDYSPQELFPIFTKYCEDDGYAFDGICGDRIMAIISLTHETRGANFGNARTIRNLFEQTISNHANRVASITNPSQRDLTTILPADVPIVANAR